MDLGMKTSRPESPHSFSTRPNRCSMSELNPSALTERRWKLAGSMSRYDSGRSCQPPRMVCLSILRSIEWLESVAADKRGPCPHYFSLDYSRTWTADLNSGW